MSREVHAQFCERVEVRLPRATHHNIYVRSQAAGQRVMRGIRALLEEVLHLRVNEAKSAVERPWKRKFLGYSVTAHRDTPLADRAAEPQAVDGPRA